MSLNEIIKEFLKKGYFVDESVLKNFSEEELKIVINKIEKAKKPVKITKEDILEILNLPEKIQIINLSTGGEISILDVSRMLKERYDFFYNLLIKKTFLPVYSINKIGNRDNFAIIGLVYNIEDNFLFVEDLTGRTKIKNISKEKVWEDSCLLFICKKEKNEIFCNNIVYPELSFSSLKRKIYLTFENEAKTKDVNIIITNNETKVEGNKVYLNFSFQPCYQIKINDSLIVVLDLSKIEFDKEKIFKTRLIVTELEKTIKYGKDIFLLRENPSVFILVGKETKILESNPLIIEVSRNVIIDNDKIINI